jgi:hypothetical protein
MPKLNHQGYWGGLRHNVWSTVKKGVPYVVRGGLGIAGAIAGSFVPGVGTLAGAYLGQKAGKYVSDKIVPAKTPVEKQMRMMYKNEKKAYKPATYNLNNNNSGVQARTPTRTPTQMGPFGATRELY